MAEDKTKKKTEKKDSGKESKPKKQPDKLAAVLIRGTSNMKPAVKDTLEMLRLHRKNSCIVVEDTPSFRGMMQKINGAVTWGEVSPEVVKKLEKERGEDDKEFYRLNPPRKGFERKGIKMPYSKGGALGYRGEDINDLLRRMI